VVDGLLKFTLETWGEPLLMHAWADFWNYQDVPDELLTTPEFDPMFVPWLIFAFVPDTESDELEDDWPRQAIGLEWLATTDADVSDLERVYIETACRSPMSVVAMEQVTPGRSLDLKDVLTGRRFHVLEQGASLKLRPADLLFTRVLTIDGACIMLGAAPFIVPPHWHTRIIDWREGPFRNRLMTREDLEDFEVDIRDLYFEIAAELLNPTPPQLRNTDGDPLALTTVTYRLTIPVFEAFERLLPLATIAGEKHSSDVTQDASGAVTSAVLSWMKAGNAQHKDWDNTVLGTLRLETDRLVAEANSTRRVDGLMREIEKRLGKAAVLVDRAVTDMAEALRASARAPSGERSAELPDEAALEGSPDLRALEDEMRRKHWHSWLDTRVPALENRTPRQAARTVRGRERLEALLASFERHETDAGAGEGEAGHIAVLRHELGLVKPAT
jgi:hypothetical protein